MLKRLALSLSLSFMGLAFSLPAPVEMYNSVGCQRNPSVIVPYFSNLYASYLLLYGDSPPTVKNYILWYLQNLNYPDRFGLTGTIYDFLVFGDYLIPTYSYDSADAYAGTFLTLIYFYTNRRGYSLAKDHLQNIKDIAYLILSLKDSQDGVVKALPYREVKYLIDNLEAYAGLALFSDLLKSMEDEDWKYYKRHAQEVKKGIRKNFFSHGTLYWAIEGNIKYPVMEGIEYPDKVAELFWKVFNGKKVDQDTNALPCEQRVAIKVFKRAIESIKGD